MLRELREIDRRMGTDFIERRRHQRLKIQVPLFIRGKDEHGLEFLELAKTVNISCSGACLVIPHHLRHDEIILLTIPAPLPSSAGSGESGTPPIHARIRRIESDGEMESAAVEFLKPLE